MIPLAVDSSPLHSGGPVDDAIQRVYTPIFWVSVVITVLVSGAILYSTFRFRRRHDDEEPVQVHGNNRIELGWTLIPFLILVTLFVVTAVNMQTIRSAPSNSMQVDVVGQQFSWAFFYPGHTTGQGKQVFSGGKLYIPAGTPVELAITSKDVNHSFYVPTLAGQVNAIPGQTNHLWLQADQPGIYYGQCTELCGTLHWSMEFTVVALPKNQFDTWLQQKESGASAVVVGAGGS